MIKGINIANEIKYSYEKRSSLKKEYTNEKCFFISHKDEDFEAAKEIGDHITNDYGINIYLDIYDRGLQEADKNNDVNGIISHIQTAIKYSTHLLCIVTEKTKESWWVPYEIGFSQAKDVKTASLKRKEAREEYLPTFLRSDSTPIFLNVKELDEYIEKNCINSPFIKRNINDSQIYNYSKSYKYFNAR